MKQSYLQKFLLILLAFLPFVLSGQTYTPIPVTGFNQDGIAESMPASVSTTQGLDGGNVLYSVDYATAAGLPGGVVNTGTIVSGTRTYQIEPFNQNNVLRLINNEVGTLQLTAPKAYTYLSLMGFGTNGNKAFTVEVKFTDGTSYTVPGSYVDWWNTTANVATALGRVNRTTAGTDNNNPLTRPNFHRFDITLSGTDQYKLVEEITITSAATGSSACFFALSGMATCPGTISTTGTTVCEGSAATINATGANNYNWFDVATGGTAIATGATFTTPALTANTNYYVEGTGYTGSSQLQTITTGGNNNRGIMFDLTAASDLIITSFDFIKGTATDYPMEVYYRVGGHTGFINNAAAWTLLGTSTVSGPAFTLVNLPVGGLTITAGQTVGIYITVANNTDYINYTTGANTYNDGTLTLASGTGMGYPFVGGNLGRTFNGNVNYATEICAFPRQAVAVTVNPNPVVTMASTNANCAGAADGTATITAIGGLAPYTYSWNTMPVQTTDTATGLTAGTYTVTVTDANMCTVTENVVITDTETIAPVVLTQDITVVLDDVTGQATITAAQIDNGSYDNCTIQTMTVAPDTFDQTLLGANTVTLTVTDANGNQSTAIATVTVTLPPAPTITCPADITVNNDASQCGAIVNYIEPGVSRVLILGADNASWHTDVQTKIVNTGRFEVVDIFNSNTGTPDIALLEQYDAILVYTQLAAQNPTALGNVIAAYIDGGGAVVDACFDNASVPIGGAYNTDTYRVLNPSSQTQGITRTLGTIDIPAHPVMTGVTAFNGGTGSYHSTSTSLATGAYIIARYDNNAPLIVAKENVGPLNARRVSLNFYPGSEDLPGFAGELWLTATDGALIMANALEWAAGTTATTNTITQTAGLASGQTFPVGVTTNTFEISDIFGQTDTCSFTVTVTDNELPVVVTQDITVQLDAAGTATIAPAQIDNGSSDNCAIANMTLDVTTFNCSTVGANTVTLTVTDVNGNVSSGTAVVTVQDIILPTGTTQDISIALSNQTGTATITPFDVLTAFTDNCGVQSIAVTPDTFDASDVGANTVTVTVTDAHGNIASLTAVVTVNLPAPPTVTCPADIAVNNDTGLCSAVVNYTAPASSITNIRTMDFEGAITFAVTYTEEQMLITASDHIDAPWPLPGGVTGARIHMGNTTWVYNGGQTFTPISVDIIANPASQVFVSSTGATISPTTTGTFTFPATADWTNISSMQWNNTGFTDIDIDNFIFNAAAQPSLTGGLSSGAAFPVGTTTNIYTITDIFGQTGTCSFNVIVTDNELPAVITQDITVQLDAAGQVSITPAQVDNGSNDNCGIDTIALNVTTFDCTNIGVNTVTLTITDVNGNVGTSTATVTVEDIIAPVITCVAPTATTDIIVNGSFETGDFTGWTTIDNPVPLYTYAVHTVSNNIYFPVASPTDGGFFAENGFDGNTGIAIMYQDVTIPANTTSATLSWDENIDYNFSGMDRIHEVQIREINDNILETVHQIVANGFNADNVWTTYTADLSAYAGQTIRIAFWQNIPQNYTGPGKFSLDNVSLVVTQGTGTPLDVVLDANGTATINATDLIDTVVENCGSYTVTVAGQTTVNFDCTVLGVNTVTVTVEDSNGNTATCNSLVNVIDNILPTITCPADVAIGTDAGLCTASAVDLGTPVTADNCTVATVTNDAPATFAIGITTVTWTVTDQSGNTATCTQQVTITDNELPAVITQDITVQLDATGQVSITPAQVDNGSNDNCGIDTIALNVTTFGCTNVGTNTVTLIVTDIHGNTNTNTAIVTVEDTLAPVVITQDLTVQLDAAGQVSITPAQVNNGSNDNCAIDTITLDMTDFDCTNVGPNTVTLTVTDVNGNVSTGTATVTVEDTILPVAVSQNITVQLNAAGQAIITPAQIDNGSTDNCTFTLSLDVTIFDCTDLGDNNVILTVTDASGNIATATAVVTVEDTLNPAIFAGFIPPAPVTINGLGRSSSYTNVNLNGTGENVAFVAPGATVSFSYDYTSAYTDGAGCGGCITQHNVGLNGNFYDCHTAGFGGGSVSRTFTAPITPGVYYITQTATWWFSCGQFGAPGFNDNDASAAVAVLVVSNTDAVCHQNVLQDADAGLCSAVVNGIDVMALDNCSTTLTYTILGATTAASTGSASGTAFNVGVSTVTYTATDIAGNVTSCSFDVIITDTEIPVVVTQDITVQLDAAGVATIMPSQIENGSTDNCAIDTFALDITDFDCTNVGANTVTLTVTDIHGNTATNTAVVIVEDNIAPVVVTQDIIVQLDAAGQATITSAQIDNGSTDACGIASMTLDVTDFDCTNVGDNTVILTVTDINGNSSTNTAIVTVEDTVAPVVVTQDIIVQLDAAGQATITPAQVDNGSADACGIASMTLDITDFECTNVGPNTVVLTVTDVNGNVASNTAIVTVQDNIAPIVVTQDITVQLDATGTVNITPVQIDNGSADNCAIDTMTLDITGFDCTNVGPNTVVLTVTDVNGNSATNTAIVTVEDNIAPTVITQNITVQLNAAGQATITPAQINNGSFDNCTIDTMVLDITAFDCTNLGDNTVVLTVTDVNGNSATNTAVVTVEDVINPVAITQDIIVELDAVTGTVTITPAQIDNGSFDNCDFTLSLDITDFDCSDVGPNTVVLTVTDTSGNMATATAIVTVQDNTLPTVITQNFNIPLNSNGVIMLIPAQVDGGSYDNCGILSMSVTPNLFNCNDLGNHIVTLTVQDVNGNIAQGTATVTVYDMYNPVAIANDITIQLDATGIATITPAQIDGGSNDICGIASISLSQTTFDCTDLGQNTVTLTVVDNGGNVSTDTAIVTVQDVMPPVVVGQPVTIFLDANGQAAITVADVDAGSTDNCGIQSLIITRSSFNCSNLGNNIVTLVATDVNGNVASTNVTVTVVDNIAPVAIAQDITVSLGTDGFVTITPAMINNNSTDNCGIAAMSLDISTLDCSNIGDTTVTLTVRDAAGNEDTATATVTVLSVPAPQTTAFTQRFCAIDEPTLSDIAMTTNFVVWYADDTTTTQLQPFTPLVNGTTYYAATGYGNCISDRIAITVTVNNPAAPTGEPIQFFCIEKEYTLLDLVIDQPNVVWYSSPVGGSPLSPVTELEHQHTYYAAYVDNNNCESILRLPVRVIIRHCDVTVHNAVSANGDGRNDYFSIEGAESFAGNKLEIFNRWGVPVYEAANYGHGDNLFKGYANAGLKAGNGLLPIGTYYYVFTFVNHDGQAITKTGFLHLTY